MGRRAGEKINGNGAFMGPELDDVIPTAVPGYNGADGRPHGAFDVHDETAEAAADQAVDGRQQDGSCLAK